MLAALVMTACVDKHTSRLDEIWRAGKIVLITDNNAHSFYLYRDRPAGFEYELASAFANYLVVDLEVITPGWENLFGALSSGKGDFIAAGLTRLPQRAPLADFSDSYLEIQQQVIVRVDNRDVQTLVDLNGKTVHVRRDTSYHHRLNQLKAEGYDIRLVLHDSVPTEELIRQVSDNEIDITIADSNIALLNRRYYPDIHMPFAITTDQSLGWAVRKGDAELLAEINRFFRKISQDGTFKRIYNKYYANVDLFDYFDLKKFHERIETRLPDYAPVIRQEAGRYGFDWRLIAALVYQESHFNPQAVSYTGVRGLMQLTLDTAADLGIDNRLDPYESIRGGVKYLDRLYQRFDDIPGFDRMLFTLASYNIGYGHVRDAQSIARRKGLDPDRWSSLKNTLPLLRFAAYHQKAAYGYARGTEPVRYVNRILAYYDILRRRSVTR